MKANYDNFKEYKYLKIDLICDHHTISNEETS